MSINHLSRKRVSALSGVAIALAAVGALLVAGPAAAHVHVDGDAVPGERATVTFRVPTESDTASTTSVRVELPLESPITSVRALSKAGWEFEAERVELDTPVIVGDVSITSAFRSITWTATGEGIAPDEFDEFIVQLGPVPDAAELLLPTEQGYSDGSVVAWDEAGGHDAQRPAPALAIGVSQDDASTDGLTVTATVLGALGIIVGLVAIVVTLRTRRSQR